MEQLDAALTQWINQAPGSSHLWDVVAIDISTITVPLMVLAVIALWWRPTDRIHSRHVAIVAGLSFLLGLGLNQMILLFIHRLRPYDAGLTHLLIAPSADFSFPSDHATAAFAVGFAYLAGGLRRYGLLFVALATAVALSRVYVGTHYVSDVIGGALTASIAVAVTTKFYPAGNALDRQLTRILSAQARHVTAARAFAGRIIPAER
jgi:undecaprenyl-diphosphatase